MSQRNAMMSRQNGSEGNCMCTCCLLPLAIAALVIAGNYRDDNPCDEDDLTIDLVLFLQVAGGLQIAMLFVSFAMLSFAKMYETDAAMITRLYQISVIPFCGVGLFYLVWGSIGVFMYNNEMSSVCIDEEAGGMVFAWSLIMVCVVWSVWTSEYQMCTLNILYKNGECDNCVIHTVDLCFNVY